MTDDVDDPGLTLNRSEASMTLDALNSIDFHSDYWSQRDLIAKLERYLRGPNA